MALTANRPSSREQRVAQMKADVTDIRTGAAAKRKRVGIDVDEEMYRSLRIRAASEGRTVNDIGRELFREYLDK